METGEPHIGRETPVRHRRSKDGPVVERYYDFAYIRINGPDGKPYGVYDFALDVTERVRAKCSKRSNVSFRPPTRSFEENEICATASLQCSHTT